MNHLYWVGASLLKIDEAFDAPTVIHKNVGLI